ncbi:alpha/beta hydrolase family protein [Salinithrix halophila]|uniref:alpha/beta hydrolase family protein n=1 Tax=Salinithrix halophila TaxID=1485204 RepID=UPI0036D33798
MKRVGLGLLVFFLLAGISAWVTLSEGEGKTREAENMAKGAADELQRDKVVDPFRSTNGKILEKERLNLKSRYSDQVDVYRIVYLSEGVRVAGFLCKPKNHTEKLPAIIYNRGGIVDTAHVTARTLKYLAKLSANKYVVIASQYRGAPGSAGHLSMAGEDVKDVLNLFPLADRLPYVDQNKKVMLGFSRGGMMTYMALKEGVDVQAAATVGGVADLSLLYEQSGDVFRNPLSRLVGDPLLDSKEYQIRSAINWADELRVPLLILHGLDDHTVSPEHSKRLAERMVDLGYEHRLVLVPGGNHYLTNRAQVRDREILNWFDHYLREDGTPME